MTTTVRKGHLLRSILFQMRGWTPEQVAQFQPQSQLQSRAHEIELERRDLEVF